jgi:hypothetical protein
LLRRVAFRFSTLSSEETAERLSKAIQEETMKREIPRKK